MVLLLSQNILKYYICFIMNNKYYEKENLIVNGRIKEETSLKMNLNISQ